MALNRYNELLNSQKYVDTYIPLPIDEILKVGAMKQQVQDQNTAEAMSYLGKDWNMLPGDNPRALELRNELEAKLKDYAYNKDFNDPNVRASWYKDRMDIAKQFSSNGEIGRQQLNYDNYKAYEKDLLSKSKELGWSSDQLQQHLNQAKNAFLTRGSDGELNYFQGQGLPNYINQNEWLSKNLKDVAADTGIVGLHGIGNLNELTKAFASGTIKSKDANKIINSLALRAQGDPQLLSSLEQEGLFRGQKGFSNFIQGQDENGNFLLNTNTPFGRALFGVAQGAKYREEDQKIIQVDDKLGLYKAKRAFDNQELEKQLKFSIGIRPSDQNDPSLTSAGMNANLRASGNAIANHWQFDDNGNLILKDNYQDTKQVVNINGKNYNLDNLPKGYTLEVEQSGFSNPGSPRQFNQLVKGPDGKSLPVQNIKVDNQELYKGMQELSQAAGRLGYHGDLEGTKDFYGNWLKDNYNRQMNFTQFDQGTQKAFSEALGVKGKFDDGGNFIISNPGQLSFSTLKGLDGKEITGDALKNKASLLEGSKIIGVAQSMTNDNYQPGDLYLQTKDNGIMIINPKNKTINDALTSSTVLTKSFNNFVNTGKQIISDEDRETLTKYKIPLDQVTGVVHDKQGNYFVGNIGFDKDKGTAIPQVTVYTTDGNVHILELDEANKILESSYLKPIIPSYNNKNFDRFTKTENLGTGLEIEE